MSHESNRLGGRPVRDLPSPGLCAAISVPEPTGLAVLATGLIGLAVLARLASHRARRRKAQ